ncbi:alpha/beta hydrolase [Arthrobacter sp. TMT4-20]
MTQRTNRKSEPQPAFHPDLAAGRFIPPISVGPRLTKVMQKLPVKKTTAPDDILVEDIQIPGPAGAPEVLVRSYRPRATRGPMPALLWLHGGGMVVGNYLAEEDASIARVRRLGITVLSVEYRLAPNNPAPAALEDAYAALSWLVAHAPERSIDPARIAIGGESAGGGLAAALALYAHDHGVITPVFQLLIYPMLDDRTVLRPDMDTRSARMWTPQSNKWGWSAYLAQEPGGAGVSPYAAPARRSDLSGLPPAWIGVGTLDIFYDEDLDYATRLRDSGTDCQFEEIPGAFHGFDLVFTKANVTKAFWEAQIQALDRALFPIG